MPAIFSSSDGSWLEMEQKRAALSSSGVRDRVRPCARRSNKVESLKKKKKKKNRRGTARSFFPRCPSMGIYTVSNRAPWIIFGADFSLLERRVAMSRVLSRYARDENRPCRFYFCSWLSRTYARTYVRTRGTSRESIVEIETRSSWRALFSDKRARRALKLQFHSWFVNYEFINRRGITYQEAFARLVGVRHVTNATRKWKFMWRGGRVR